MPVGARSDWLTSLASTSIGEPLVKASPNAATTLAAPGPLVSSAAATSPVAR